MWTEEEKRYLRALMRHDFLETGATEELRRALTVRRLNAGNGPTSPKNRIRNNDSKPPVGEFRVLVIGAKGVGKTSILTRVGPMRGYHLRLSSRTLTPVALLDL